MTDRLEPSVEHNLRHVLLTWGCRTQTAALDNEVRSWLKDAAVADLPADALRAELPPHQLRLLTGLLDYAADPPPSHERLAPPQEALNAYAVRLRTALPARQQLHRAQQELEKYGRLLRRRETTGAIVQLVQRLQAFWHTDLRHTEGPALLYQMAERALIRMDEAATTLDYHDLFTAHETTLDELALALAQQALALLDQYARPEAATARTEIAARQAAYAMQGRQS
jgi:hypothetical protein